MLSCIILLTKSKELKFFPPLRTRLELYKSPKVKREILIRQDFVLKNSATPILPSTLQYGQWDYIPNTTNPIIFHSSSTSHHNIFDGRGLCPPNTHQGKG